MAGPHVHRLDPVRDHEILAEQRRDPVTKALLAAGDAIVACAHCRVFFLQSSWEAMNAGNALGVHGGYGNTLAALPRPAVNARLVGRRRGQARAVARPASSPPTAAPPLRPAVPPPPRRSAPPTAPAPAHAPTRSRGRPGVAWAVGVIGLALALGGGGRLVAHWAQQRDAEQVVAPLAPPSPPTPDELSAQVRARPDDPALWEALGSAQARVGARWASQGAYAVARLLDHAVRK